LRWLTVCQLIRLLIVCGDLWVAEAVHFPQERYYSI